MGTCTFLTNTRPRRRSSRIAASHERPPSLTSVAQVAQRIARRHLNHSPLCRARKLQSHMREYQPSSILPSNPNGSSARSSSQDDDAANESDVQNQDHYSDDDADDEISDSYANVEMQSLVSEDHQSLARPRTIQSSSALLRGRRYTLSLVSVPVQCTTSGGGLCDPPLIAQLSVRSQSGSESTANWLDHNAEILAEDDLPYLVATVSLWTSAGTTQVVPSGTSSEFPAAVRGRLTTSGQILKDSMGINRIFFIFPGLQITRSGSWRFGVSLMGLWAAGSTPSTPDSRDRGSASTVGSVIVGVKSETITNAVPEDSPLAVGRAQVNAETVELLMSLADQGVDLAGSERSSVESHE